MAVPARPKIYHICHVDCLPSIVADSCLWCDAEIARRKPPGKTIGISGIKRRRMHELTLSSHPGLHVGACVPFYFCPRSMMLYLIHRANDPELPYRGGQEPIVHLEADLRATVAWAEQQGRRWAFTRSNAGARYFEDWADLAALKEINWNAVAATKWSGDGVPRTHREGKQAEFLLERSFPWELVERIGVKSRSTLARVAKALSNGGHRPPVKVQADWYY